MPTKLCLHCCPPVVVSDHCTLCCQQAKGLFFLFFFTFANVIVHAPTVELLACIYPPIPLESPCDMRVVLILVSCSFPLVLPNGNWKISEKHLILCNIVMNLLGTSLTTIVFHLICNNSEKPNPASTYWKRRSNYHPQCSWKLFHHEKRNRDLVWHYNVFFTCSCFHAVQCKILIGLAWCMGIQIYHHGCK